MIKNLSLIFGSRMKAQEILFLKEGIKEVVRQGFSESELPKVEKYCNENNLSFVKSRFKVLLADENSYSNKGLRISEDDKRDGLFFVYISNDEEKAWLAAYYEMMGNDKDLGLVLGYPECCVDFFMKNFNANNPNPEHIPTNPFTNLTMREHDSVLISHFPCNSDCEKSMVMARRNLFALQQLDKSYATNLMSDLLPKR